MDDAKADGVDPDLTIDEDSDGSVPGGVVAHIALSDYDKGDTHTVKVSDDRFEAIQAYGEWWLKLKAGAKLDHETEGTIELTLTVMDNNGGTDSTPVTITVDNVNEAPTASGDFDPITGEAGKALKDKEIDLLSVFSDPDGGDTIVSYIDSSDDAPSWLTFSVKSGKDGDGNPTATGLFTGTPPAGTADSYTVTITATDTGGAKAEASVKVVIDDGNDDITAVDLLDGDGKVTVEADVDENDDSGVVLGEIRVVDPDDAMHPNGDIKIDILKSEQDDAVIRTPKAKLDDRFEVKYDDAGVPWLALKAGMSLDKEKEEGSVDVIIRAVDMNGDTNAKGDEFTGNVEHQTVTVVIADRNDAPKANTIGNWWVTAEDGLKPDEIGKGGTPTGWLSFFLEGPGDNKPAFTDPDGDTLTYTLEGPSFLEINPRTGQITNTKGGVPVRGVHTLTVTASDGKGGTDKTSFKLAIGFSDPDNNYRDDNNAPSFGGDSRATYTEGSGPSKVVATFTVTDDDNDLEHHEFALDTVTITQVMIDYSSSSSSSDVTLSTRAAIAGNPIASLFSLSKPRKSSDMLTWTYDLMVEDTDPSPKADATDLLDYEDIDEIVVTVTAKDGVAAAEPQEIDIRLARANDLPVAEDIPGTPANIASGTYGVSQSEPLKEILYIKLEDIWSDAEDDPDDLEFGASASGGWIKILHGPAEWGDIKDGRDGDSGNADDVRWNVTTGQTAVVIGDNSTEPGTSGEPDQQVVIIELDRTGGNDGQGEKGSFTLTATDKDGGTGTKTYTITPVDLNLPPSADAVEISGSAREGATLRASFNDEKDPDLRGDAKPALVLYQWYSVDSDGTETLSSQGTDSTYKLTQKDVGSSIRVKALYYEVSPQGQLVPLDQTIDLDTAETGVQTAQAMTSRPVSNTPDKGTGSITVLADANVLRVLDEDFSISDVDIQNGPLDDADINFSWEVSDNGRGGWTKVDQTGDSDTQTLELRDGTGTGTGNGNGQGKYYRAVASYDSDGGTGAGTEMESIYSGAVRVSNIRDAVPDPIGIKIDGSAFPGGTLTVNAGTATVSVQWQMLTSGNWVDIDGATGSSLALTQANADQVLRAVVSVESTTPGSPPGVTAVVAVNANGGTAIPGGTTATATPVKVDDYDIEVGVTGTGHHSMGATVSNNAGWNLSRTEEIDLSKLFSDPDSPRLIYTVASTGAGLGDVASVGGAYVYDGDNAVGGVLVLEISGSTAKLTFNSDVYRTHDGDPTDGMGNMLTLNVQATDEGGRSSVANAAVKLHINVAPTGIVFNNEEDGSGSQAGTAASPITVDEHVGPGAALPGGQFIARVDVRDENSKTHEFGTHKVTIDGDDRFEITNTGKGKTDGDDDGPDGSTWEVRLKEGEKLDFETQKDMDPMLAGKQIVLTLTATDGGGLSTPPGAANAIKLTITVNDIDRDGPDDNLATIADNDINHPPTPTPNDVPGLKDDETTTPGTGTTEDTTSERRDDDTDDDADGGAYPDPSMDAMMMSTLDDGLF